MRIDRVREVQRALRATAKRHRENLERAIRVVARLLQRESMKLVPVDLGALRASAFVRVEKKGNKIIGVVGYTAAYAVFVHENLNAAHGEEFNRKYAERRKRTKKKTKAWRYYRKRGPNQQAKFLETPARELRPEFRKIIKEEMEQ